MTNDLDNLQSEVEKNYKPVNKYILVSPIDNITAFDNGMAVKETRGKKDIICAIVELAEVNLKIAKKAMCWFPAFAGMPIKLPLGKGRNVVTQEFLIVPYEDIILFDKTID